MDYFEATGNITYIIRTIMALGFHSLIILMMVPSLKQLSNQITQIKEELGVESNVGISDVFKFRPYQYYILILIMSLIPYIRWVWVAISLILAIVVIIVISCAADDKDSINFYKNRLRSFK